MVARILNNELYTGNASYPAILSAEEYRHAVSAKPATGVPTDTIRLVQETLSVILLMRRRLHHIAITPDC